MCSMWVSKKMQMERLYGARVEISNGTSVFRFLFHPFISILYIFEGFTIEEDRKAQTTNILNTFFYFASPKHGSYFFLLLVSLQAMIIQEKNDIQKYSSRKKNFVSYQLLVFQGLNMSTTSNRRPNKIK